jgi:hypothetical protein
MSDYPAALQRIIEHLGRGDTIGPELAYEAPHHAAIAIRVQAENANMREALTRLRDRSYKMVVMDNGWVEDVTTAALGQ